MINGRGADEAGDIRKSIQLDAGEDELAFFDSPEIPGALSRIEVDDRSILLKIGARSVVHIEDAAVRQRHEAGAELVGILEHGKHDLAHVGHEGEVLRFRRIDALRILDLHGRHAVLRRVRLIERVGVEYVPMGKQLRGKGLQRQHVGADVGKKVVGDIGLQCRRLGHGRIQDRLHRLLGHRRDGRLLLSARLSHGGRQILLHPDGGDGVNDDQRGDEEQHKREYPLLQAADFDPSDDPHVVSPTVKPCPNGACSISPCPSVKGPQDPGGLPVPFRASLPASPVLSRRRWVPAPCGRRPLPAASFRQTSWRCAAWASCPFRGRM